MEDHLECVDTPDHLLEAEAWRLSLPAASCAELRVIGACELAIASDLCAKTCGVCDGKQSAGRRLIGKCNSGGTREVQRPLTSLGNIAY